MNYKPFTTNYTYQIIDDIKEYLEETNKDQTTLDTLDLCHLIGEIERLGNELQAQIEDNTRLNEYIEAQDKKLQQKESIIKEIREYIEEQLSQGGPREIRDLVDGYGVLEILDKVGDEK